MRSLLVVLTIAGLTAGASAGATPWQQLAPDVSARLISSDVRGADGRTGIALQIDMPQSTKTYWKIPGETGIAPILEVSDGTIEPLWPYPKVDTKEGFVDFAYYGPLVLPMLLSPGSRNEVRLSITLGICSDICVPASAEFALPLKLDTPDAGQGLRIRQAMADVPLPWTGQPEPIGAVRWSAAENALLVELNPEIADPGSVIAAVENDTLSFGAPQKSREANLVVLPLLGNNIAEGKTPETVSLIFMTARGPYEVQRHVQVTEGTAQR